MGSHGKRLIQNSQELLTGLGESVVLVEVAPIATEEQPSTIVPISSAPTSGGYSGSTQVRSVDISIPSKEIWVFFRQLSLLQKTGTPLLSSFKSLAKQTEDLGFAIILTCIANSLEHGDSLSQAMARFPQTFPSLYRTLIREGEESGMLADSLVRAAELLEREQTLKYRVFSALLYPTLVLVLGSAFGLCAFHLMVPFLLELFSGQTSLPPATQFLLGLSALLGRKSTLLLLALLAITVSYVVSQKLKTPKWSHRRDLWLVKAPFIGPFVRLACVVRILPTMSATISSGLPLTLCLELCADVSGNNIFRKDLLQAKKDLINGIPLEQHFARQKWLYGPAFLAVFIAGLESGTLDHGTERLLRILNIELDIKLEQIVSLLQPAALLVTGGIVGFLCVATLQPLAHLVP
jgi:type IV pilus assembly protein PilC